MFAGAFFKPELVHHETRRDIYLYLAGVATVGIKLRGNIPQSAENKLEIKVRQSVQPQQVLSNNVTGHIEQWIKYDFGTRDSDPAVLAAPGGHEPAWIGFEKIRSFCQYQSVAGGQLRLLPQDVSATAGCNVGLTLLEIERQHRRQHWWTLSFEAFGPQQEQLTTDLRQAAQQLFPRLSIDDEHLLTATNSYGYPQWLHIITGEQA
jgi:hypothetical protein